MTYNDGWKRAGQTHFKKLCMTFMKYKETIIRWKRSRAEIGKNLPITIREFYDVMKRAVKWTSTHGWVSTSWKSSVWLTSTVDSRHRPNKISEQRKLFNFSKFWVLKVLVALKPREGVIIDDWKITHFNHFFWHRDGILTSQMMLGRCRIMIPNRH